MMFLAAPGTHIVIFIEAVLGEELDAIELIQALAADKSTVLGFDFFLAEHGGLRFRGTHKRAEKVAVILILSEKSSLLAALGYSPFLWYWGRRVFVAAPVG